MCLGQPHFQQVASQARTGLPFVKLLAVFCLLLSWPFCQLHLNLSRWVARKPNNTTVLSDFTKLCKNHRSWLVQMISHSCSVDDLHAASRDVPAAIVVRTYCGIICRSTLQLLALSKVLHEAPCSHERTRAICHHRAHLQIWWQLMSQLSMRGRCEIRSMQSKPRKSCLATTSCAFAVELCVDDLLSRHRLGSRFTSLASDYSRTYYQLPWFLEAVTAASLLFPHTLTIAFTLPGMVETRLLDFGQSRQDLMQPHTSGNTGSSAANSSKDSGTKPVDVDTALQKVCFVIPSLTMQVCRLLFSEA